MVRYSRCKKVTNQNPRRSSRLERKRKQSEEPKTVNTKKIKETLISPDEKKDALKEETRSEGSSNDVCVVNSSESETLSVHDGPSDTNKTIKNSTKLIPSSITNNNSTSNNTRKYPTFNNTNNNKTSNNSTPNNKSSNTEKSKNSKNITTNNNKTTKNTNTKKTTNHNYNKNYNYNNITTEEAIERTYNLFNRQIMKASHQPQPEYNGSEKNYDNRLNRLTKKRKEANGCRCGCQSNHKVSKTDGMTETVVKSGSPQQYSLDFRMETLCITPVCSPELSISSPLHQIPKLRHSREAYWVPREWAEFVDVNV